MGMHRLGRYAYSLVDAAAANKTFLVWMKLKGAGRVAARGAAISHAQPRAGRAPCCCNVRELVCAEGYDPNGNYVGVTAMQVAIENQNEEMFLVLLKFGASPERPTASKARGTRRGTQGLHCLRALRTRVAAERARAPAHLHARTYGWLT